MSVTVERFDVDAVPDHRRPRVASFACREGALNVHVSRDDGSLWLFAQGPAGGDRGRMVIALKQAGDLREWLDVGSRPRAEASSRRMPFGGGRTYLVLRDPPVRQPGVHVQVVVGVSGWTRRLILPFDVQGFDELMACLREWATAAARVA